MPLSKAVSCSLDESAEERKSAGARAGREGESEGEAAGAGWNGLVAALARHRLRSPAPLRSAGR
eukprot:2447274-Pleurochrysis_carterae.AAC.1